MRIKMPDTVQECNKPRQNWVGNTNLQSLTIWRFPHLTWGLTGLLRQLHWAEGCVSQNSWTSFRSGPSWALLWACIYQVSASCICWCPTSPKKPHGQGLRQGESSFTSGGGRDKGCLALSRAMLLFRMMIQKKAVCVSQSMSVLVLLYLSHFASIRKCSDMLALFLSWVSDSALLY